MPDCTLQLIYLASCHLIIFSKKSIRALCLKPNCRTPVVTLKVSKNRHFLFLKYLSVPIKLVIFSYTKHYSIQYNTLSMYSCYWATLSMYSCYFNILIYCSFQIKNEFFGRLSRVFQTLQKTFFCFCFCLPTHVLVNTCVGKHMHW